MTRIDKAIGFGTDDADDADDEQMTEAARALVDYARHDDFERDVEEIIGRVIVNVAPTNRLRQFAERLSAYFDHDEDPAHALLLLVGFPPEETVEMIPVADVASEDEAMPLKTAVRRISGLFGAEVSEAFSAAEFDPDNWANLELRYSFLPSIDLWRAELEITKFDETRTRLDGPAQSFLKMINYLLVELTRMPAEAHAFGEDLEEFRTSAKEFLDQYETAQDRVRTAVEGGASSS